MEAPFITPSTQVHCVWSHLCDAVSIFAMVYRHGEEKWQASFQLAHSGGLRATRFFDNPADWGCDAVVSEVETKLDHFREQAGIPIPAHVCDTHGPEDFMRFLTSLGMEVKTTVQGWTGPIPQA